LDLEASKEQQVGVAGQGAGLFFGNGVSNFNGAGSVNMMNTPMGSVGTFVSDGTANFAGNVGMVAAGVGQVGFAGQGMGFNQGFGTGQINGVGNVNFGAANFEIVSNIKD
jgi:hypothetical protein